MGLDPLRTSDTWSATILLVDSSRAPVAPDSTPVAMLLNGTTPLATTVTVTQAVDNALGTITGSASSNITGAYILTAAMSARSTGDVVRALIKATIGGVNQYFWSNDTKIVQWGATAMPNSAARTSTGLPALADLQSNSTLGPAQTVTDGDGTTTQVNFSTALVGAAVGHGLRCTDTLETSRITAFSQNIGSGLWQFTVSPAFTTFSNPAGHTFAAVNLPRPIVDASGNVRAVDSSGNALGTDPLASAVPGSYAAGTAGKAISDIRKVVQARGG